MNADDLIEAIERAEKALPDAGAAELLDRARRQLAADMRAEAARLIAEADALER